jgi:hypothetical protein
MLGFFSARKRFPSPFRETKDSNCLFIKQGDYYVFYDQVTKQALDIFSLYQLQNNCSFYDAVVYYAEKYNLTESLKALGLTIKSYKASHNTLVNKQLATSNSIDILNQFSRIAELKKKVEKAEKEVVTYLPQYQQWQPWHIDFWAKRDFSPFQLSQTPIQVIPALKIDKKVVGIDEESEVITTVTTWSIDTGPDPIFCYVDNTELQQIYKPLGNKKVKFRTVQKKEYFLDNGKNRPIIISKGFKDALLLFRAGYSVIFKPGEGQAFSDEFIQLLPNVSLYCLYDNDKPGIKAAHKTKTEIEAVLNNTLKMNTTVNLIQMPLPYKDFDDAVVHLGKVAAKKLLKHVIKTT